jgi:hypothetical protein
MDGIAFFCEGDGLLIASFNAPPATTLSPTNGHGIYSPWIFQHTMNKMPAQLQTCLTSSNHGHGARTLSTLAAGDERLPSVKKLEA